MKVGIVGFGKIGIDRYKHLSNIEGVEVVKIYDIRKDDIPENLKCKSAEEILTDNDIDVVFISTPNNLNGPYTLKAINNNKHVFCEKPPSLNSSELEKIKEALNKNNSLKLMYGFNHRFHGAIIKLKSLVESSEFGKVLWMRGRYGKSVDEDFFGTWRSKKELAGGGILIDQGIHMLDLFCHLAGSFDEVKAFLSNLYWRLDGIEDNAFVIMKNTDSGVVASLHSTMTQWRHLFSLEVFFEKGYCVLNGLKTSSGTYGKEVLTVAKNRSKAPAATWESEDSFEYEIDNSVGQETEIFISSIKEDKAINNGTIDDAIRIMNIIDKVYQEELDTRENNNINPKI